ncbi:hypothetical protein D3C76_950330 [compost metagenome]
MQVGVGKVGNLLGLGQGQVIVLVLGQHHQGVTGGMHGASLYIEYVLGMARTLL